jgi:hypothetical protein
MASGGPRTPSNPAPVSGPGALSKRTDGKQPIRDPGGLAYGDGQELRSVQAAAPMSGMSPQAQAQQAPPNVPLAQMSPNLFDPTDYPQEPMTAGADFGPGPGSEMLRNPMAEGPTQARLKAYLPVYIQMAESPYVSPEFKAYVNYLRGVVSG